MIRPTFLPLIFVILLFTFPSALAQETQSYNDDRSSIVTSATQNLLTVVSFLIGYFFFSFSTEHTKYSKTPPNPIITKYFNVLILALMVPSVVIIIYGIILIGVSIEPKNLHYLLLTFLFVKVNYALIETQ